MATTELRKSVELDQSEVQYVHTENTHPPANVKRNHQGVALVPQPSDDFQDPLVRVHSTYFETHTDSDNFRPRTGQRVRKS